VREACTLYTIDAYEPSGKVRPVLIIRKANTKGKLATRTIPIIDDLRTLLANYHPSPGQPYLFPGRFNGYLDPDSADKALRKAMKRVGLIGVSSHSFRRTALTQMSNNGTPLRVIQEVSGHRNLEQLQVYIEVRDDQVLGAAASTQSTDKLQGKLVLTGSSTVAPLAAEIGKRFEAERPGVRIDVQSGGSSRGITDARKGLANIGMVSRALKDEEKNLQAFSIARDGVSIILHKDNPVKSLSDRQVVDIYTGKIGNWKQVGGKDAPITVVNKAEGRSTLELFAHYFKLKNSDIKAQVVIGDNEQGIKTVAGNPNAIGYVSIGTAEHDAANGLPVKLLPVNGVAATTANVQNGTFPISRPLNLVMKTQPQGLDKEFIDFARSQKVQNIVKEQNFVSLSK
jgi:phosphate transport system substrate-binding protein